MENIDIFIYYSEHYLNFKKNTFSIDLEFKLFYENYKNNFKDYFNAKDEKQLLEKSIEKKDIYKI